MKAKKKKKLFTIQAIMHVSHQSTSKWVGMDSNILNTDIIERTESLLIHREFL